LQIQEDEFNDRLDKLEAQGYTYGYIADEVECIKNLYKHRLNNMLVQKEEEE
jgi:hypothetical protein